MALEMIKNLNKMITSLLSVACISLFLSSCGLSDDAPVDANVYDLGNLNGSCELNTEALNNILSQDVMTDINCLEDNLNQFVDFVRRENPNYIGRLELTQFIEKFFPESKEVAEELLKLVFDLNSLILRDPQNQLSITKLKSLFSIVRVVNTDGRTLYNLVENLKGENYWTRRQNIFRAVENAARKLLVIMTPYAQEQAINTQLDITNFLEELKEILDLTDDDLNIDKVKNYLFAKKLLFGGDPATVTSTETMDLFDRASDLITLFMDVLFVGDKDFTSKRSEYFFYYDVVKDLGDQFSDLSDTEPILVHQDLITVAQDVVGDEYNISNMENTLLKIKEKFFGGAPERYNFRDIKTVLNWGLEFSGMLYFNDLTYDHYQSQLNSPKAISGLNLPKIESYNNFPNWLVKKYWEQFDYISSNYRFFHDDDNKNHFFNYYKRYKSGFNNASMLRWAVGKIMQVYGHFPEGKRRKELDGEDLRRCMDDLEGLARELGFWPDDEERFISEAVASSDLFMYHADGNQTSSTEEVTEYALNAIHGFSISSQIHDELTKRCVVANDGESIPIPCFRGQFLDAFFNKLNLGRYYNKLYEYYTLAGKEEIQNYLINIELYARIDPSEDVPVTKEDLGRILVIVGNLESAFIRFDIDKDGVLSRGELDLTFLVFQNLLKTVAGDDLTPGLYKSIFLYLIKNMKVPSTVQLLWFHAFGKKKNIVSSRFNISAILSNFVLSGD
jgi:hypothetical protein